MKTIKLGLSFLFLFILLMHIDTQAQEFVQNRQMIAAPQYSNASAQNAESNQYRAAGQETNQLAQADRAPTYQKRTIKFEPVVASPKEVKKAKQKYKSGQFKRPKQNPRKKE